MFTWIKFSSTINGDCAPLRDSFFRKGACFPARFFIIIFLLSFSYSEAFSQALPARPNHTDSKKLRQGDWILWFDDNWQEVNDPLRTFYYRLISYHDDLPQ